MFDNYFTTLQNEPPYVITSRMLPLPQPVAVAFTAGGEGDRRNEIYIVSARRGNVQLNS